MTSWSATCRTGCGSGWSSRCRCSSWAIFALLAIEGTKLTLLNQQRQFGDSGLSYGWVTAAVPVGCVLIGIALVYNMVRAWQARGDGKTLVYSRADIVGDAPAAEH